MISSDDASYTYEYSTYFKILPQINDWDKNKDLIKDGTKVPNGFTYSSDKNSEWMTEDDLKKWINSNK